MALDTTSGPVHHWPMAPQVDLKPIGWSANHIGVSVTTLRRWANDGRVAYVKLPSGQLRFRVEDLDAMVAVTQPSAEAS